MTQRPAILIVDDDSSVRRFTNWVLCEAGWRTIVAPGGPEALASAQNYDGTILLAVVDLIMPGMGGLDFANQLLTDRPSTKILYVSGSLDSVVMESIRRRAPELVLPKPFTGTQLLQRIRVLLNGSADAAR